MCVPFKVSHIWQHILSCFSVAGSVGVYSPCHSLVLVLLLGCHTHWTALAVNYFACTVCTYVVFNNAYLHQTV